MNSQTTYETCAAVAAALPEPEREMFAALIDAVSLPHAEPSQSQSRAARRWLRDAGWVKR